MAIILNATTNSGLSVVPDNSGQIQLQSSGTTIATVTPTGITTQVGAPCFSATPSAAVTSISSATVTIGSGGAVNTSGGNSSWSDGTNTLTANGGSAGGSGSASNTSNRNRCLQTRAAFRHADTKRHRWDATVRYRKKPQADSQAATTLAQDTRHIGLLGCLSNVC